MNNFLARFKNFIKSSRRNKSSFEEYKKEGLLTIGSFDLKIGNNNPLLNIYSDYPSYGQEFGRLSKVVSEYYPKSTAIDIGANIGDTCAIIKSYSDLKVVCIEGDKEAYGFFTTEF